MAFCMNVLKDPVIFLPSTALIAIILLVWAQLSAGGKERKSFTLYLGFAWIHWAIFFSLLAFGLHVFKSYEYAIGFLGLAFLMAIAHVLFSALRILLPLKRYRPAEACIQDEDLVQVDSRCKKWSLLLAMAFATAGLSFMSFYMVGLLGRCFLWAGIGLVFLVSIEVLILIICANKKN